MMHVLHIGCHRPGLAYIIILVQTADAISTKGQYRYEVALTVDNLLVRLHLELK